MPRELHPENLIPQNKRTKAKQREIARMGGKKSQQVQREKKFLSQMWGEFLAEEFDVQIEGEIQKIKGFDLVKQTGLAVMARKDSSSVSMIKEIREATEGSKVVNSGEIDTRVIISFE